MQYKLGLAKIPNRCSLSRQVEEDAQYKSGVYMPLTLSIIDAGDMSVASQVKPKVFTGCGGTIGRSQRDDWELPDPQRYVSSRHAIIEYEQGEYYLLDTSTNGVFLNNEESAIGRDQRVKLGNSDRIYIGEYVISAAVTADITQPNTDFDQPDIVSNMGQIPNDIDPLELLGGCDEPSYETPTQPASTNTFSANTINHTPGLDEHFTPPAPQAERQIPDDWGLTQAPKTPQSSKVAAAPQDLSSSPKVAPISSQSQEQQIPANWSLTTPPAPAATPKPAPIDAIIPQIQTEPSLAQEQPPIAIERPRPGGYIAPKRKSIPQTEERVVNKTPASSEEYQKVLEALGIDPKTIPEELTSILPEIIGLMVRQSVTGLIEVLMARSNMKSAFRVDQTMIRPVENNPLKFSVGVDEAIENMLFRSGRGYLPALDAIQEGFNDIKAHQMATMAGMQGALQDVMRRFDPETLEQRFTVGPKNNLLLSAYNKTKYWDRYKELYEDIAKEATDNFQNILGEGFMRAYEEQMRRMERTNHDSNYQDK